MFFAKAFHVFVYTLTRFDVFVAQRLVTPTCLLVLLAEEKYRKIRCLPSWFFLQLCANLKAEQTLSQKMFFFRRVVEKK